MIAARHILGTFDESLAALRNNVLMMAGLTERSLERAMKGLVDRNDDLCANAIADDEEIDQLEKQIDKDGVDILLRSDWSVSAITLPTLPKTQFTRPLLTISGIHLSLPQREGPLADAAGLA